MSIRPRLVANWEGIYTSDFTLDQVRRRCQGLAEMLAVRGWSCLVAHDTRFMAHLFARDSYHILAEHGVAVTLVSTPAPLPMVQFALEAGRASCALMVSARNRPYWYNGLVFLGTEASDISLAPSIAPLLPRSFPPSLDPLPPPPDQPQELRSQYIDTLRQQVDIELIRRAMLTVFVDPMNGSTAGYLPLIISENGQTRAIEINRETDPLFGKVTPLPTESGLNRLRKLVRESDSHVGLAFSADGAALGVVDKNGEQLETLEIALLLAAYLARQHRQKGSVIVPPPPPNSPLAANLLAGASLWESTNNLKIEFTSEAGARIADALNQERPQLLIGATPEGEFVAGRYNLYSDALLAGLLVLEMIARNGGHLRALLDEFRANFNRS